MEAKKKEEKGVTEERQNDAQITRCMLGNYSLRSLPGAQTWRQSGRKERIQYHWLKYHCFYRKAGSFVDG
jgi:hypothetical protein